MFSVLGSHAWRLLPLAALLAACQQQPQSQQPAPPAPTPPIGDAAQVAGARAGGDADSITTQLKNSFASITSTLDGVHDSASADSAAATIRDLTVQIDTLRAGAATLPADRRASIANMAREFNEKLEPATDRVLAIPNASDRIGASINALRTKLSELSRV